MASGPSFSNVVIEWLKSHLNLVTVDDLNAATQKIMSAIIDQAALEDADLTQLATTLNNVVSGITALDVLITNFQNSPGTMSPADQAALDGIQAKIKTVLGQAQGISTTPPAVPPAP